MIDNDGIFDTKLLKGKDKKPQDAYTIKDTHGCSCSQIIEILDLCKEHKKFGCSKSAVEEFISMLDNKTSDSKKNEFLKNGRGISLSFIF